MNKPTHPLQTLGTPENGLLAGTNLTVVILAAGKGTRMHSALPKVLHPIAGSPMVCRVLTTAQALQPNTVVVVVGHGAQDVERCAKAQWQSLNAPETKLQFALQHEQKGTGHAVQCALTQIQPPISLNQQPSKPSPEGITLVLYGDVPCIQAHTLQGLLQQAAGGALVLLTANLREASGYGRIVRCAQGHIQSIVEEKDATAEQKHIQEINTGLLACPTAHLQRWLPLLKPNNVQGEYYLTDIVAMANAEGLPIHSHQPQHLWEVAGVNCRTQQAELERAWQNHVANTLLHQGVALTDPKRLDIRGQLHCGQDVRIDLGCVFEGNVVLEDGVHIGPYCVLRNTHIAANTHIHAYSHLDGATVGSQAVVGPYARLRPGTMLAEGVHIGNFVEVKNSQLGANTKANHLSYLGDATVGARVNIGAGTITCNYDGAYKHRTTVEDDAFIGSNTQLVAPITVGQGATIGAGTTLTKDAPAHALTLARAKAVTFNTWKRPNKNTSTGTEPSSKLKSNS